MPPPSVGLKLITSSLKMETVCSFKTYMSTYKSVLRYNPKDKHLQGKIIVPKTCLQIDTRPRMLLDCFVDSFYFVKLILIDLK